MLPEDPLTDLSQPEIGESPLHFLHDPVPPIPPQRGDLQVLQALRRIIRAVELFSRRLTKEHRITAPQLVCLHRLLAADGATLKELSQAVFLSSSTLVGIIDRLEHQGLVARVRSSHDRRKVLLHVTQAGRELVSGAPSPLQQAVQVGLQRLGGERQAQILASLEDLVAILDLNQVDAAPLLDVGPILSSDHQGPPGDQSF